MRRSILFATVLVAAALIVPTTGAASTASMATPPNGTSTPTPEPTNQTSTPYPRAPSAEVNVSVDVPGFPGISSAEDCTERVGPLVDLCSAKRIGKGTVAVVLVHEVGGQVTLTDSFREGNIPRESFRVGRTPTRIEFSIVPNKDAAGITIDTGRNLYGKHISAPGGGWLPTPGKSDVLASTGTAVVSATVLLPLCWYIIRRYRGGVRDVA